MALFNSKKVTNKDLAEVKYLNTTKIGTKLENSLFLDSDKEIEKSIEYLNWISITRRIFTRLFKWEGLDEKQSRLTEQILFDYGKVALIKLPNGDIIPSNFTYNPNDIDIYGYPNTITLLIPHVPLLNNSLLKKDFVILFNNSNHKATLTFLYDRIRAIVKSIRDVDNSNDFASQKLLISGLEDDTIDQDIETILRSRKRVIKVNSNLQDILNGKLEFEDRSTQKQSNLMFQLNFFMRLLGFETSSLQMKKERQPETETANDSSFKGLLLEDMILAREENLQNVQDILGLTISIKKNEEVEVKNNENSINENIKGDKDELSDK